MTKKFTSLAVGQAYPFQLLQSEGAATQFLVNNNNVLQIVIPNISKEELFALKKGKVTAGFLYESGDLLWLFTFYDKKGPVFTLDAPFDARLYPADALTLPDITDKSQRLAVEMHVVDERKIIRALRYITLPNARR